MPLAVAGSLGPWPGGCESAWVIAAALPDAKWVLTFADIHIYRPHCNPYIFPAVNTASACAVTAVAGSLHGPWLGGCKVAGVVCCILMLGGCLHSLLNKPDCDPYKYAIAYTTTALLGNCSCWKPA
jgi:hypothetical protein